MRTRVIGCTVAIVLAAAACGASKASALEVVRGAASKTAAARTARIALAVELHNPGVAAGNANVSGTGVVDYGAKRGLLDMRIANAGRPVSTVKAVYTGTVLYMRIPQLATTGTKASRAVMPAAMPRARDAKYTDRTTTSW